MNLAYIGYARGTKSLEEPLLEALAGFTEQENLLGEFQARSNLWVYYSRAGKRRKAALQADFLKQLADRAEDPKLKTKAQYSYANHLLWNRENLRNAYRTLKMVEASETFAQDRWTRYGTLSALARVCVTLNRPLEAIGYFKRLEQAYREASNQGGIVYAQSSLAFTREEMLWTSPRPKEIERAKQSAEEALSRAVGANNPRQEAQLRLQVANFLRRDEAAKETVRGHLERCLALSRQLEEPIFEIPCSSILALTLAQSDPSRARQLMRSAMALASKAQQPELLIAASRLQMRLEWVLGPQRGVRQLALRGLDLIETIRQLQPPGVGRIEAFSRWLGDYHLVAGKILENGRGRPDRQDLETAFAVLERMRGRFLLEELRLAERPTLRTKHEDEWNAVQTALQAIANIQRKLFDPTLVDEEREDLGRELVHAERTAETRREELQRAAERTTGYRQPDYAGLTDIQRALADDEAMLLYQVGLWEDLYGEFGGGSWVWVVTARDVSVHRMPDRLDLEDRIRLVAGFFAEREEVPAATVEQLHRDVVAPALRTLPATITRLNIVPDGALHSLAFPVLRSAPQAPPLGTTHEISVTPSATVWLGLRQRNQESLPPAALAIADPEINPSGIQGFVRSAYREMPLQFEQLPMARQEGRELATLVGGASVARIGTEATESQVKRDLKNGAFALIHFATHAIADEAPERSALILAPDSKADDGLLQARELSDLGLKNRVVVLYACRSAAGSVIGGEGALSLTRAFAAAGARAVVGNLWVLRDDDALFLSRPFYQALIEGKTVATAVRRAQQEAYEAGRPPAAWAGLVILGDGAAVPFAGGSPGHRHHIAWLRIAGISLLTLLVAVIVGSIRRFRT